MKMKILSALIRKCKSLSSQLGSRRLCYCNFGDEEQREETVYVGSSRRQYVIDTKYLRHPLINALTERSRQDENGHGVDAVEGKDRVFIKCEVVLFDHLLWMLNNADLNSLDSDQSLEDLAELYRL